MIDLSKKDLSEQQDIIRAIVERNIEDHAILQGELSNFKFKPEALRSFIEVQQVLLSPQILRVLHDKRINEDMRPPKIDRAVKFYAEKPEGAHGGRIVQKVPAQIDNADKEKYKTRWLEKLGHGGDVTNSVEDVFCEYIGSHLVREILGLKRSAKLRLYIQDGEVRIMSRYIKDFQTIHDSEKYGISDANLEIKGFALFFIANALLGDYDMNHGNAGSVIIDGKPFWARIDNDSAFSYVESNRGGGLIAKNFVNIFQKRMLEDPIYQVAMFNNFNFACELARSSASLDVENLKTVIRIGIEHMSSIYGPEFLENEQVKRSLSQRAGFTESEININDIQARIIRNLSVIKEQLIRMSSKQISSIFPLHGDIALEEYLAAKTEDGIDAQRFFNQLKMRGVDIKTPAQFNIDKAVSSFNLPESDILSQDFIAQGIIYPIIQNRNSSDSDKIYATELAIKLNMQSLVTVLIKKGFKSNVKDLSGRTLLHYAVENGNKDIISALLKKGENPNILDKDGKSALYLAVQEENSPAVEMILEHGALACIPDKARSTPLMSAAEKGNLEIFMKLIDQAFDPNLQELDDGRTALFLAANGGHSEISWKLLEKGANPNIKDKEGLTAKDVKPEFFGDEAISKLLKKSIKRNDYEAVRNLIHYHEHLKEKVLKYIDQNTSPNIQALIVPPKNLATRRPLKERNINL